MNFGEYLKQQRETRGWTQPVAAEKIGIEQSYLSKLETGKATPSEEMFERLAEGYEFDLDRLAEAVSMGELERLREIAAIRDLVRRGQQASARGRRRWLVASLLMIVLGGAILSLIVTETRYANHEIQYVSIGVIQSGENDFVFNHFEDLDPGYLARRHGDDPLLERIDPVYRYEAQSRGAYFTEDVPGGHRMFQLDGERHVAPTINAHLGHALAVALLLGGLCGLFVSRRW